MKKSLVALAALAASAAFAQSSVTISGGVSMGVQQSTVRDATGLVSGQLTRIAGADIVTGNSVYFTAVEDLGGGLKVTGQIQQRIGATAGGNTTAPTDNQNTWLATGDLFVQVDAGFGSIKAGKYTFASNASYNAFGVRALTGLAVTAAAPGMGGDNTVQYTTPSMSGLTATVGVSVPGTKVGQDPAVGLKLNYAAGPLAVQFAQTSSVNGDARAAVTPVAAVAATGKAMVSSLGANYDFGAAKLWTSYFRRSATLPLSTTAPAPDANGFTAGITVPVGAATFKAGVMNNAKTDVLVDRTSYGVDYSLSKRTMLIAEYARDKRAASNDQATNNYFLGLSHTF
ncbi:MAG: porin [Ramlibacter sp.]|uniref:porin n=1 Tax=Ramlibacter sp. TaxID=1917967 RepID=UPI00263040FD|nr:porin [Ramlibacter sp.]MDH4377074.1 porin [Ramlibacter sp.]